MAKREIPAVDRWKKTPSCSHTIARIISVIVVLAETVGLLFERTVAN
jgi:hypothetical protein